MKVAYTFNLAAVLLLLNFLTIGCTRPEDNAINRPLSNDSLSSQKITSSSPENYTIEISNMKFQPEIISVNVGDTVIWQNKDMVAHCVTEENSKSWTSGKINPGESWKMAIKASTSYFCAIHQVMHGKINLEK